VCRGLESHPRPAVAAGATFETDITTAVAKDNFVVICLLANDALSKLRITFPKVALVGKTIVNFGNGSAGASAMDATVRAKGASRSGAHFN